MLNEDAAHWVSLAVLADRTITKAEIKRDILFRMLDRVPGVEPWRPEPWTQTPAWSATAAPTGTAETAFPGKAGCSRQKTDPSVRGQDPDWSRKSTTKSRFRKLNRSFLDPELIKLVSPQAAQPGFLFLLEKLQCCTSCRDLFKDTLLRIERGRSPAPGRNRSRDLCYVSFPLPLCYNHCPKLTW